METAILILQDSLIQQKEQLSLAEKKYNLCVVKKQADFRKRGINNIKGFIAEIEDAILVLERAVGEPSDTDSNCNIQHVSKSALLDEWNNGYARGCEDTHDAYQNALW